MGEHLPVLTLQVSERLERRVGAALEAQRRLASRALFARGNTLGVVGSDLIFYLRLHTQKRPGICLGVLEQPALPLPGVSVCIHLLHEEERPVLCNDWEGRDDHLVRAFGTSEPSRDHAKPGHVLDLQRAVRVSALLARDAAHRRLSTPAHGVLEEGELHCVDLRSRRGARGWARSCCSGNKAERADPRFGGARGGGGGGGGR